MVIKYLVTSLIHPAPPLYFRVSLSKLIIETGLVDVGILSILFLSLSFSDVVKCDLAVYLLSHDMT